LLFVPLGDLIGNYFQRMPPLQAYSWDLGGAITGTALFGLFSYFWFSPILGFIITTVAYLLFCRGMPSLMMTGVFLASGLAVVQLGIDDTGIWSPYNHISVLEIETSGHLKPVSSPSRNIVSLRDPPFYVVLVNHSGYMWVGTIDGRRYTEPGRYHLDFGVQKVPLTSVAKLYSLPHLIRPGAKDVLVVGSGGGTDVEAALLYGAEHVDAVEIDPVIIGIGHQYNPSQVYKDPRVSIHNTDARAFFKQTDKKYDMVVFGFLDSQGLFSQMSNIRLDGYVHTVESFREAFGLLREGGLMTVSFYYAGKTWLIDRLIAMVRAATGTVPLIDIWPSGQIVVFAGKGFVPQKRERFLGQTKIDWAPSGAPEATDDWPYLYLRKRFIPSDYLVNIGVLLAISMAFIFLSSGRKRKGVDLHFFFLGAGFLLLETKSIITISLYFGTTWFVSMIVILGVLIMVLLANLAATWIKRFSLILYAPLIASVGFLYLFPAENVLALPFLSRLIYSLAIIPLPIFFAGLIFSATFRESHDPTFSFGSNLLGAMVGGFAEYLGMITGTNALLLVVVVFYLASLLIRLRTPQLLPSRA